MDRALSVANLRRPDIDQAFALIQALYPDLAPEDWRAFALSLTEGVLSRQCGIICVRNAANYLCGLFVYHVEPSLRCGQALVVDLLAALDVVNVEPVMQAILEAVRSTATRLQCGIARVRLSSQQAAFARFLAERGLRLEGQVLSTPI